MDALAELMIHCLGLHDLVGWFARVEKNQTKGAGPVATRVYRTNNSLMADETVYLAGNSLEADEHVYFVDNELAAERTVFVTDNQLLADKKVYQASSILG